MAINKQLKLYSHFQVEQKALEDSKEPIRIQGYANTISKDRYGDVIPSTAWNEAALKNYRKNPIILAYHNHSQPIGVCDALEVDEQGLKISAKISSAAKDVYQLIKDGVLKAFSVGFIVKEADYDQATDIFVIKELELLEVSVVSVPANQDSVFDLAKAFGSEEEYAQFKKSFIKTSSEGEENKGSAEPEITGMEKELNMDKEQLELLIKSAVEAAAVKAVEVGQSGAERLVQDIEKKLQDDTKSLTQALDGLRAELAEKSAEIQALQKSKMTFEDKKPADVSYAEIEKAVLFAKVTGQKVDQTKAFSNLVQKYGAHVASDKWENTVSANMMDEIRRALVVAPRFRNLAMPSVTTTFPVNPEAGYASWVGSAQYGTANSSGAAQTHALKELSITAHKLATKEFLTNEEEYDAIIALMPIVRDAMIRRMSKAWDKALLAGTAANGADPIKGLTTYNTAQDTTVAVTAAATVANLRALRQKLGVWGLDPAQVVYFVTNDVYYDLLEDTNFMTMDKVGNQATLLTGQIGSVGNSPVIVTGELQAGKVAGRYGAVAVNTQNFMVGNYKGLQVESDYFVEYQQRILVSSLRTGFQQISTVDGQGVACLKWSAT